MLQGACHCGAVKWEFQGQPSDATICNCTLCRRYGVVWAYDYLGEAITIDEEAGARAAYVWGDRSIDFHFCATCGCITDWTSRAPDDAGRTRIAVNLRLAEPETVAAIPLRLFDGLIKFEDVSPDGRCVADLGFAIPKSP